MAHAGNPTDLAKQPATSTSTGLWKTAFAAIVLLALVVGMVIVTSSLVAANKSSVLPAADHRYDQIENERGAAAAFTDRSYDQIESQRGVVTVSDLTLDRSQDRPVRAPNAVSPEKVVGHRGAMIRQ